MSRRPRFDMEIRSITPAVAKVLLKDEDPNRKISARRVNQMALTMKKGEWALGPPIMLDRTGRLMDGQHRLSAVVQADVAVQFVVIRGVDRKSTFGAIDSGKSRTLADWLYIEDPNVTNASVLASVARMLTVYLQDGPWYGVAYTDARGSRRKQGKQYDLSIIRQGDIFREHQTLIRESMASVPRAVSRLMPQTIAVMLHMLFAKKDRTLADCFFHDLTTGERVGRHDPVYLLRERLISNRASLRVKMMRKQIICLTIIAWNATRSGTRLKLLKSSDRLRQPPPQIQ